MRKWTKRSADWYRKLSTVPGLANDIAELLIAHDENCVSRLAALYWIEQAGLTEVAFLERWGAGEFHA